MGMIQGVVTFHHLLAGVEVDGGVLWGMVRHSSKGLKSGEKNLVYDVQRSNEERLVCNDKNHLRETYEYC